MHTSTIARVILLPYIAHFSCAKVIYIGVCTEYQNSAIKLYVWHAGVSGLQIMVYSRDITICSNYLECCWPLCGLAVVIARLFVLTVSLVVAKVSYDV
jgi:hypothetical protein